MKKTRPDWMKEPLKNKKIDDILLVFAGCKKPDPVDPVIQLIYEYIKELEEKNEPEK